MVAIVTSGGLGLDRSSASFLGADGLLGQSAQGRGLDNVYVNAATGNLVVSRTDEMLFGVGQDAVLADTYNSMGGFGADQTAPGTSGDNWRESAYRTVTGLTGTYGTANSTITRTDSDGSQVVFTWNSSVGAYVAKEDGGAYDQLKLSSSTWTWTDGATETYDNANGGRIVTSVDRNGAGLTFTYTTSGQIDRVTTQDGEYVQFVYNAGTTVLARLDTHTFARNADGTQSATTQLSSRVSYGYTNNRLTSVTVDLSPSDHSTTDSNVFTINYDYYATGGLAGYLKSISQTDGSLLTINYESTAVNGHYRVSSVVQAVSSGVSRTTSFSYGAAGANTTTIIDANQTVTLTYDALSATNGSAGQLRQIAQTPVGGTTLTTAFTYDPSGSGNVLTKTAPGGQVTTYGYDAYGNQISAQDALGDTVTRTFQHLSSGALAGANLLLTETRYTATAAIGSTPSSGAETTSYLYDSNNRLAYVVSPQGDVTKYGYYASGQLQYTLQPTATPYTGSTPTFSLVDAWFTGLSDLSTAQRVDTTYDFRGAVAAVASYTQLTSGNWASGGGQGGTNPAVEVVYVYDQAGMLLSRLSTDQTGTGTAQTYAYDGLGRLIAATDPLGHLTQTTYADASDQTTIASPDGVTQTTDTYDQAGDLISSATGSVAGAPFDPTQAVVAGAGDLNGDGYTDVVMRNNTTGQWGYFAGGPSGYTWVSMGVFNTAYTIVGIGDINGDHVADVVWQNHATGDWGYTAMGPSGPSWHDLGVLNEPIVGVGDIDGDGKADVVWQDPSTRTYGYATVNAGSTSFTPYTIGSSSYLVKGVADVNGDTRADVFFINDTNDGWSAVGMNASGAFVYVNGGYNTPSYSLVGLIDMNGDGRVDSIWRNNATGDWGYNAILANGSISWVDVAVAQAGVTPIGVGYANGVPHVIYPGDLPTGLQSGSGSSTPVSTYTYQYDAVGNLRVSIDALNPANNTYFLYDNDGRKVAEILSDGTVTQYVYDADSNLISTIVYGAKLTTPQLGALASNVNSTSVTLSSLGLTAFGSTATAGARSYTLYDNAGRVKETIDSEGRVTQYGYDGASELTSKITYANTLSPVTLQGYATNGPPTNTSLATPAPNAAADLSLSYTYDNDGNLVAVKDAGTLGVTRYAYDSAGRQVYAVDAMGDVTKTAYDASGRVVQVTRYANPLGTNSAGAAIMSGPLAASASAIASAMSTLTTSGDETTTTLYDKTGRVAFTIDPVNQLCAYTYDGAGNLLNETHYGIPYTGASNPSLQTMLTWVQNSAHQSTDDRTTRYVYDADNREAYSIDATGAVTAYSYDVLGNVLQQTQYATTYAPTSNPLLSDMTNWVKGLNGQTVHADPLNDRTTRYAYDADGRLAFVIADDQVNTSTNQVMCDVTGYAYDAAGHVTKTIHYSAQFSGTDTSFSGMQTWATGPSGAANPASDQVTRSLYDAEGRLAFTLVNANYTSGQAYAYVTAYSYGSDASGRPLHSQIQYATAYAISGDPSLQDMQTWAQNNGSASDEPTSATYDGLGRMTSSINGLGQSTNYTYAYQTISGANYLVTTITDPENHSTQTATDADGRTAWSIVDPGNLNLKTSYKYDAFGNLAQETDPNANASGSGASTAFYYDLDNRLVVQVDPMGYATKTDYDHRGQIAHVTRYYRATTGAAVLAQTNPTDPLDEVTTYKHDLMGRLTDVWTPEAFGAPTATTHYDLDAFGDQQHVTNALGGVTDNTFDHQGRLIQEVQNVAWTDSAGASHTQTITNKYHYNALGERDQTDLAYGAPEQETTTYAYDLEGRQTQQTLKNAYLYTDSGGGVHGQDATQTTQYDAFGNVILSTDPDGAKTYTYYDLANRKAAQVDPVGAVTTWSYNATTNTVSEVHYKQTYTPTTMPLGGAVPATISGFLAAAITDLSSDKSQAKLGAYRWTNYVYDAANRLKSTAQLAVQTGYFGSPNYILNFTDIQNVNYYDANGNLIRTDDGKSDPAYAYYDADNRKTAQIDQAGYLTTFQYDAEGNVTKETQYATQGTNVLGSGLPTANYTYNSQGYVWPAVVAGSDRVTDSAYDRNGRLTSQTRESVLAYTVSGDTVSQDSSPAKVAYQYDAMGNITKTTQATLDYTSNTYDSFGRLIYSKATPYTDYTGSQVTPETDYTHDELGRVTRSVEVDNGGHGGGVRTTKTQYGVGGRVISLSTPLSDADPNNPTFFTTTYAYDLAGHKVLQTYARQKSDGTSEADGIVFVYDAAGRLTSQIKGQMTAVAWSSLGSLGFSVGIAGVTVTLNGSAVLTQGESTDQFYDAYGEVVGEGTNVPLNSAGAQKFAEYDGAGRVWRTNMTDGVTRAYAYDQNGNTTVMLQTATTNASGNAVTGADLRSFSSLFAIMSDASGLITQTITVYDQRNEVIETYQPAPNQTYNPVHAVQIDTTGQSVQYFFGGITPNGLAGYATGAWGAGSNPLNPLSVSYGGRGGSIVFYQSGGDGAGYLVPDGQGWYYVVYDEGYSFSVDPSGAGLNGGGTIHVLNGSGAQLAAFAPGSGPVQIAGGDIGYQLDPNAFYGYEYSGWVTVTQDMPWGTATLGSVYISPESTQSIAIPHQLELQGISPAAQTVRCFWRPNDNSNWQEFDATYDTTGYWHLNVDGYPFGATPNGSWEVRYMAFDGFGGIVNSAEGTVTTNGNAVPTFTPNPAWDWVGGNGQTFQAVAGDTYLAMSGMPAGTAYVAIRYGNANNYASSAYAWNGGWGQAGLYYWDITGLTDQWYWAQPMNASGQPIGNWRVSYLSNGMYAGGGTGEGQMSLGTVANRWITLSPPASIPTTTQRARYSTDGGATWSSWQQFGAGSPNLDLSGATDFWTNNVLIDYEAFNNNLALAPVNPAGVASQRVRFSTNGGASWGAWVTQSGSGSWTTDVSGVLGAYNDNNPQSSGYLYQYETYDSNGQLLSTSETPLTGLTSRFNQTFYVGYFGEGATSGPTMEVSNVPAEVQFTTQGQVTGTAATIKIYYRVKGSTGAFTAVSTPVSVDASGRALWNIDLIPGLRPAAGQPPNNIEYYYDAYAANGTLLPSATGEDHVHGYLQISNNSFAASNDYAVEWVTSLAQTISSPTGFDPTRFIDRTQHWNAFGQIDSEKDGLHNETDFAYNTLGDMTTKTDPTVTWYDEHNNPTTARQVEHYYYDVSGRQIAQADNLGHLTTDVLLANTGYNGQAAETVAEYDPDGTSKQFGYDVFGEERTITTPFTYMTADGLYHTTTATTANKYDAAGDLIEVDHAGRTVGNSPVGTQLIDTYTYDGLGQRLTHTYVNALNSGFTGTDKTDYDAQGRVTQTIDDDGHVTAYAYTWESGLATGGLTNLPATGGWLTRTTDADTTYYSTEEDDLFGHIVSKRDLAGRVYSYIYNLAGQLAHQSNNNSAVVSGGANQSIDYVYYTNGYISSMTDNTLKMKSTYAYDYDGNRVLETYNSTDASPRHFENALTTYDAMNRITEITDTNGQTDIKYEYDAVGNRRAVLSTYTDIVSGAVVHQNYWYKYDQMNRFTLTMGTLDTSNNIQVGAYGVAITYDAAGNRASATYGSSYNGGYSEWYHYSADGYLETTDYEAAGSGAIQRNATSRTNDALGRVTTYVQNNASGALVSKRDSIVYNGENQITDEVDTDTTGQSNVHNDYDLWTGSNYTTAADYIGQITHSISTRVGSGAVTDTKYFYQWWDQAKQSDITVNHTDPTDTNFAWTDGESRLTYDANGHVVSMAKQNASDVTVTFYDEDANGQVLVSETRDYGASPASTDRGSGTLGPLQRYYYFNGKRVGDVSNNGQNLSQMDYAQELALSASSSAGKGDFRWGQPVSSADFDQNFQPINSQYPGFAAQTYTVQASSETLQSIALAVWGDASLWYLIANANGLTSPSSALVAGRVLIIPNKVTNFHNNASTLRPYNPGEAIGDSLPTVAPVGLTPDAAAVLAGRPTAEEQALDDEIQQANMAVSGIAGELGSALYLQQLMGTPLGVNTSLMGLQVEEVPGSHIAGVDDSYRAWVNGQGGGSDPLSNAMDDMNRYLDLINGLNDLYNQTNQAAPEEPADPDQTPGVQQQVAIIPNTSIVNEPDVQANTPGSIPDLTTAFEAPSFTPFDPGSGGGGSANSNSLVQPPAVDELVVTAQRRNPIDLTDKYFAGYGLEGAIYDSYGTSSPQGVDGPTQVGDVGVTGKKPPWWQIAINTAKYAASDFLHAFAGRSSSGGNYYGLQAPVMTPRDSSNLYQQQVDFHNYVHTVVAPEVNKQLAVGAVVVVATGATGGAIDAGLITITTPVAVKAGTGFVFGYGGAALSGVKSTEGRLASGLVGAVALPGGSYATGLISNGLLRTAAGGGLAYAGGGLAETVGEYGDVRTGYRTELDPREINNAAMASAGAYTLFGEGVITAVGVESTAAEATGSAMTATGAIGLDKLLGLLPTSEGRPAN